ncbi:hypothetical protein H6G33_10200 [Calothrix sp. FACHB-1219]|uniref:hypothetical protein n=1 Tax=unclassified Calothrix TaxID=2619626 RepID=UPI0016855280|nr:MULTISPECIES: hypothetical protein [unclassified Calothrix]MBD2201718.1 hypothetical protein [Calothrix sp. FACHB-168]MBD2217404.1 hypothetical protein [Calothrix sp. FACHB-1219]
MTNKYVFLSEIKDLIEVGDYVCKQGSGTFRKVIEKQSDAIRVKDYDEDYVAYGWNSIHYFLWIKGRYIEDNIELPRNITLVYNANVIPVAEMNIQEQMNMHFSRNRFQRYLTGNLSAIYYFKKMILEGVIPYERAELEITGSFGFLVKWIAKNKISFSKCLAYDSHNGILAKNPLLNQILIEGMYVE